MQRNKIMVVKATARLSFPPHSHSYTPLYPACWTETLTYLHSTLSPCSCSSPTVTPPGHSQADTGTCTNLLQSMNPFCLTCRSRTNPDTQVSKLWAITLLMIHQQGVPNSWLKITDLHFVCVCALHHDQKHSLPPKTPTEVI